MKVTNLSDKTLYLADLKFVPQGQEEGRKGEDRFLAPAGDPSGNDAVYLPNTSQVIRSANRGTLKVWSDNGVVLLDDFFFLANAATQTLTHGFGLPVAVQALKFTGTVTNGTIAFAGRQKVQDVVLGGPLGSTNYFVVLSFAPTGPTGFVTNKTVNGFTINLDREYTGTVTYDIYEGDWEEAMGSYDAAQNAAFTAVAFTNTSGGDLFFKVKLA